ncbi:hypothetical protein DBV14_15250 [Variovorax sp. KBW07]|uniref:hypothetical protein n=1 Tax=Variovorax sp. KBW07 TaxID=2153358 RepID=UPI000F57F6D5|nr:hypothetical protein [Variovorax sp. KBW07]RQO52896.1 hypothetical protein DBV14_15250 [Variovorax sp. KBW07]
MLSCYGFAVLAHNLIGAGHAHGDTAISLVGPAEQTLVTSVSFADATAGDAAGKPAPDDAPAHDEAGSEHAELVDARNDARLPQRLTEPLPKLGLTTTISPLLERPKRPPRLATFVA